MSEPTRRRVLIVDDDENTSKLVRSWFAGQAYEFFDAADGETGLRLAVEHLPDLILLDLRMPGLDGIEAARRLRADSLTRTIPVIVLTACRDVDSKVEAFAAGADDYITKPFVAHELLGAIKAALAKRERIEGEVEDRVEDFRQTINSSLPHELQTPLTTILGYGEILSDGDYQHAPHEVASMADQILSAGRRLNRLTQNFLLLTQLELANRGRENAAPVRSSAHVPCGEMASRIAQARACELQREDDLRVDVQPANVALPAHHFEKVIDELIDNALKFSSPGTPVVLSGKQTGDQVTLRVADRGRGMSHEQVASVSPYHQFERSLHEQQGMGLGLSIVYRLCELYGGSLTIDSRPGEGTTVSVVLPLAAETVETAAPD